MFERVQLFTVCLHSFAQCTDATCLAQGSSLRLSLTKKKSFHLSRHVQCHDTRNTHHVFLILFFCSRSHTTAKVDHVHNTLRKTTETTRGWQSGHAHIWPNRTTFGQNRIWRIWPGHFRDRKTAFGQNLCFKMLTAFGQTAFGQNFCS